MEPSIFTKCIHDGKPEPPNFPVTYPLYYTSTFSFRDVEHMLRVFSKGPRFPKDMRGEYVYTRGGNPTVRLVEEKLALLEGGEEGLGFSSGMAAITATVISLVRPGSKLALFLPAYGETQVLFSTFLPKFGFKTVTFGPGEEERLKAEAPDLIFVETPANPTLEIADLRILSELGGLLVVDNTWATPVFQRPLDLGADVVVHSATKYLSGHSDALGGVVVGPSELISEIRATLFLTGGQPDPFSFWLINRGLKTLHVRMPVHWRNAQALAEFLEEHPKVERVFYPGLDSFPWKDLAKRQMKGFSGMISFYPKGGETSARRIVEEVEVFTFAVSLGAVESLIELPYLMTHRGVGKDASLVRLSVGLEPVEDLLADLRRALAKV